MVRHTHTLFSTIHKIVCNKILQVFQQKYQAPPIKMRAFIEKKSLMEVLLSTNNNI